MPGAGGCGSQSDRWEAALSGWLPAMGAGEEGSVAHSSSICLEYIVEEQRVYPQLPNPGAENWIDHLGEPTISDRASGNQLGTGHQIFTHVSKETRKKDTAHPS